MASFESLLIFGSIIYLLNFKNIDEMQIYSNSMIVK